MNLAFIENYVKLIIFHPDNLVIKEVKINNSFYLIQIYVHNNDIGRVIGKGGNMINAIKNIIWLCKVKFQSEISYKIEVLSFDKYKK